MKKVSKFSKLMLVAALSLPVCGQMNAGLRDGFKAIKAIGNAAEWCVDTYKAGKDYVVPVSIGAGLGICTKVAVNVVRRKAKTDTENLIIYAVIGGISGYLYKLSKKQTTMHQDVKATKKAAEATLKIAKEQLQKEIEAVKENTEGIKKDTETILKKVGELVKSLGLTKEQVEQLKKEFGLTLTDNNTMLRKLTDSKKKKILGLF